MHLFIFQESKLRSINLAVEEQVLKLLFLCFAREVISCWTEQIILLWAWPHGSQVSIGEALFIHTLAHLFLLQISQRLSDVMFIDFSIYVISSCITMVCQLSFSLMILWMEKNVPLFSHMFWCWPGLEVETVWLDDDLKRVTLHRFAGWWQAPIPKWVYQREAGWCTVKSETSAVK